MGSRYLTELAAWCRAAGLPTVEYDGWQTRARSSGGYDGDRPWCVMWHHTASRTTPDNDVHYIAVGCPDAPVSNLYLSRDGVVYVIAAGATNTNGKGGPTAVSRGTVPLDKMNTYAVSIEAANDGVGEPWSAQQIDAYHVLSLTLTERLGLAVTDVCTHAVWAPTRKIDPAQAGAVQGAWHPSATNSSGTWSLADIRAEQLARADGEPDPIPPLPPIPLPDDEETMRLTAALDTNGTIWVGDGSTRRALASMDVFNNYVVLSAAGCYTLVNTSGEIVREAGHVREVGDVTVEALGVHIH